MASDSSMRCAQTEPPAHGLMSFIMIEGEGSHRTTRFLHDSQSIIAFCMNVRRGASEDGDHACEGDAEECHGLESIYS